MKLFRKMRTDLRLWLWLSLVAFVSLGFVSMHTGGVENKVGPTYFWGIIVTAPTSGWKWWEILPIIAGIGALLAITAVTLGWVAQAVIVSVRGEN